MEYLRNSIQFKVVFLLPFFVMYFCVPNVYAQMSLGGGGSSSATTNETVYVGNLYEQNGTNNTSFVYLGNIRVAAFDQSGKVSYFHQDHLGSTNVLTDELGAKKELVEYAPFGATANKQFFGGSSQTSSRYYTGQNEDEEIGLYYYGARYYDPGLGRFITADTIVPHPNNPQALNRYSYAGNNPVTYFEDGNGWFIPFIVAAVKGATVGATLGAATAAVTGGNIGRGALFGAIGGGAFGGLSSAFNSLATFAMTGTTNVSLIGNAANMTNIIGTGFAGAGAGAAVSGTAGSNVGRGALAGLASATIVGVGNKIWPLGTTAIAGGVASEIEGGSFGEGAKFAAIGRSMGTMLEIAVPADTIEEQNPQPGDLAFMKPESPLTALISLLEGGPFSHVKILDDQGRWVSATPGQGVDYFSYDEYTGRRGKVVRKFQGNQQVINAAKNLAVSEKSYGFLPGQKVCSTTCGSAISRGTGQWWTGIGPNSQYQVLKLYGE